LSEVFLKHRAKLKGKETTFSVVDLNLPQIAQEVMIDIRFNSLEDNVVCLICKNWFGKTLEFFCFDLRGFKGKQP